MSPRWGSCTNDSLLASDISPLRGLLRRRFSQAAGVPQSATTVLLPSPFGEGLGVRPGAQAHHYNGGRRKVSTYYSSKLHELSLYQCPTADAVGFARPIHAGLIPDATNRKTVRLSEAESVGIANELIQAAIPRVERIEL
jgi:hypothetical protein